MRFLKIKTSKNKKRADGTKYSTPVFVTKTKKYGKVINEKTISVKKPILITGAHDSGKSRWINRLYENKRPIGDIPTFLLNFRLNNRVRLSIFNLTLHNLAARIPFHFSC